MDTEFEGTSFESTNTRTEVIEWYKVEGAPRMTSRTGREYAPASAKFVFVDGECSGVNVYGVLVKQDGSIMDKSVLMSDIFIWNQSNWPAWLHHLYRLADRDFLALKLTRV
jgi:hypothetical protein